MIFKLYHNGDQYSGGHNDLFFEIPKLGLKFCYDSYYILLNERIKIPKGSGDNIVIAIKYKLEWLFNIWIKAINLVTVNKPIFFQIGIFDEYSDSLRVEIINKDEIKLTYGYVRREHWEIDEKFSVDAYYNFLIPKAEASFNIYKHPFVVKKSDLIDTLFQCITLVKSVFIAETSPRHKLPPTGVTFMYKNEEE